MRRLFLLSSSALLVWCGCASAPAAGPSTTPNGSSAVTLTETELDPQALELEAMLLLLADRRILEPLVVDQAMRAEPAVRRRLALVLGRIADTRSSATLAGLLTDSEPAVRQAAAFALGRLPAGDANVADRLLRAVRDKDRETGERAVEALARQGVTLATVVEVLSELAPDELLERLLPSLFRFQTDPGTGPADLGVIRWAEIGLQQTAPHLRRAAAYGLARKAHPEAAAPLRGLLNDDDPWIAGWAARALGQVGARTDFDALLPLLARPEAGPVIQALRASGALITRGAAAPSDAWRQALRDKLDDPRSAVRIAALEVAGSFLRDDAIGRALVARAKDAAGGRERELALVALAEGGDPRAAVLIQDAARDPEPAVRVHAAQAAGFLDDDQLVTRLSEDEDATVRGAALGVRLAAYAESPRDASPLPAWVGVALADPDPGVRARVLDWAAGHPIVPVDMLVETVGIRDRLLITRAAAVAALQARAETVPSERTDAIAALERLTRAQPFAVRRAARLALTALGRPSSAPGPASQRPVAVYRDIFTQTHQPRFVDVETTRGTLRLRLACAEAPMTCLSFLQLSAQGFYNGVSWHRVVPDFVVQGGDPRGDGQGGPGYQLRDEPNLLRYGRGVLGMARSGPDTAGSQFFISLSLQPHLDGDYTAFGTVIAGDEVLDELVQGDRILGVTEVSSPQGKR